MKSLTVSKWPLCWSGQLANPSFSLNSFAFTVENVPWIVRTAAFHRAA